jgi:hypothetical protein
VAAPRTVGEQVPVHRLPHFIGHVQPDRLGEVIAHPTAGLDMRSGRSLDALTGEPQPLPQRLWITLALMMCRPIRPAARLSVALKRPPQPKNRLPLLL